MPFHAGPQSRTVSKNAVNTEIFEYVFCRYTVFYTVSKNQNNGILATGFSSLCLHAFVYGATIAEKH